jgi:hypothetical protein
LRSSLIELYYSKYWGVKECKIEIINKKVYVNCITRAEIIKIIRKINPHMGEKEICKTYKKIISTSNDMKKDIESYKELKKMLPFTLGNLETEGGVYIKKAHYTRKLETEFQYNNKNYIQVAMHGTSNVPKFLTNSQFEALAMINLVKNNAKKPGTIFTCGDYKFTQVSQQLKYMPN